MDPYLADIEDIARTDPHLAGEIRAFKGLAAVMAWMHRLGVPLAAVEIVQQDEFSLDFVLPLERANLYLVFGIT